MLETTVETSFVKTKDVNPGSANENRNALYDCAYDSKTSSNEKTSVSAKTSSGDKDSGDINRQASGHKTSGSSDSSPKAEQRRGDTSAADSLLPPVTLVGDGKDAGSGAGHSRPDKTSGKASDGVGASAKPPTTDGTGSAIGRAGQDGLMAGSYANPGADPSFKPTPPEFQFSKEKTAAAALTLFAKDELDLNGDGFVNKVELSRKHDELAEAAKHNPKSKEIIEKLQAVNYMTWDYEELSKAHDDEFFSESSGITIHDLASTVSSVNKAKHSGN